MKLSVITATYNAMDHLPYLVASLRDQIDKDFEWVVADGASTDGTLEYLNGINDLNVKVVSQHDFGIYDALNRGIKASCGEFYLVVGADDLLNPGAVGSFKKSAVDGVDVVTASLFVGNRVSRPTGRSLWLDASSSFISGHAVGSVFRKDLHRKVGYYSNKFPIAADQLFMMRVYMADFKIREADFIAGRFSDYGLSSLDRIGTLTEIYRVLIMLGFNKYLQTGLLFLKIVKSLVFDRSVKS